MKNKILINHSLIQAKNFNFSKKNDNLYKYYERISGLSIMCLKTLESTILQELKYNIEVLSSTFTCSSIHKKVFR